MTRRSAGEHKRPAVPVRRSSPGHENKKSWNRVYDVVRGVPRGNVATYGQVAALAGMPGAARQVGWALAAMGPDDDAPWHRVINARGEISPRGARDVEDLQRALLESEGVSFDTGDRVDLGEYGWQPRVQEDRPSGSSAAKSGKGEAGARR
ncbi:MAG: MGMT family protein [bacterium]|nr:methyltransferase [Deltaproteobacteria bacterium]MCP4908970.1 MGMT family protein [bacterium]